MEIVRVPLLNANEDELLVSAVFVHEGDEVRAGQLLVTVESTKASSEIEAPSAGFVRRVSVREGDRVPVGRVLVVLTATADEALEGEATERAGAQEIKATHKARELAEQHGVDLASLGVRGIVKERDVMRALEARGGKPARLEPAAIGPRVVIFGAGGHARVLVDVMREGHRDLVIVGAVDDSSASAADVLGVPVLGSSEVLASLREQGVENAVLGVGDVTHNATRIALFDKLRALGFRVPNLIHPRAMVEPSARMGAGNQLFAGAIVGSNARLGDNTIVNSGVVVSHDCVIGSHTHLTPGCILAGGVTVGRNCVIGMGVTIYLGITIGDDVVVSNGVHVMKDVPDGVIVRASERA
ncbi:MAG: NeuD/PglB/VioB family sugar acetyltransferase [Sandaracinaceae bacterium]|nr:NeuD/PglB/VioB family sugar acetyltransferase [Sandaracinaceae bacterium]